MKFTEVLEKQRKIYVDFLEEQISKCGGSSELLLESHNDEPEEYYRIYRFDCVKNIEEECKIFEYNHDTYVNHAVINYNVNELHVELNPFFWNGCEIEIQGDIKNWNIILDWIKEWIDEDEDDRIQNGFLSYKIHNFQRPLILENTVHLAIDLGSAKVDALIGLINIFEELGIKKVKIHSGSIFNEEESY